MYQCHHLSRSPQGDNKGDQAAFLSLRRGRGRCDCPSATPGGTPSSPSASRKLETSGKEVWTICMENVSEFRTHANLRLFGSSVHFSVSCVNAVQMKRLQLHTFSSSCFPFTACRGWGAFWQNQLFGKPKKPVYPVFWFFAAKNTKNGFLSVFRIIYGFFFD